MAFLCSSFSVMPTTATADKELAQRKLEAIKLQEEG
jgi:hypothetical protein